jgi:hypothetical protein
MYKYDINAYIIHFQKDMYLFMHVFMYTYENIYICISIFWKLFASYNSYTYDCSGENKYRVPAGSEKKGEKPYGLQDAEKNLNIIGLPDMLCLTLKRFNYDVSTSSMAKVNVYMSRYLFFFIGSILICIYALVMILFMYVYIYIYIYRYINIYVYMYIYMHIAQQSENAFRK